MRIERIAAAALLALSSGCGRLPAPAATASVPSPPGVCRVSPDGGPEIADRGIGGTGGPVREADRGIGGTGGPALAASDVGGTGIVAVITGFASVCLAGQEVGLPADAAITIGDRPASAAALRAGQVAIVEAAGSGTGLRARRVMIRSEVSGPVEAEDGERLRIAGQEVVVGAATWGERPRAGEWTVVSGLRRADGVIEATRLDRRAPGEVLVRGKLREDGGQLHIGGLLVQRAPGLAALAGQDVTASGRIEADTLIAERVVPDLLATDPAALFGPAIGVFYVETFAVVGEGRVRFGQGFSADAVGLRLHGPGRAVLRLERGGGGLRAVGFGPPGSSPQRGFGAVPAAGRAFEPAPVPNRAIGGPGAGQGRRGAGLGRGDGGAGARGGFRPGGFGRPGGGRGPEGGPPGR